MGKMQNRTWTPNLGHHIGPIYLALAEAIGDAIRLGDLAPGDKLPTQKELAVRLGIDVTTVTRGYAQASQAGLIESHGRRGSFVKAGLTAPKTWDVPPEDLAAIDAVGMNTPPEPEGGALGAAIRDGLHQILSTSGPLPVHYQPTGGMELARRGAAQRLSRFLPATNPEQIIITSGGQNALHAIFSALLAPGDRVAAPALTYPGFLSVARQLKAQLVAIEMDEEGLVPEALEAAARMHKLKALFVVPTNDNPTTATLSDSRRKRIAAIAEQFDFAIVEDDPYAPLAPKPPTPITAYAPERSWYISSFSKSISPFLRIAEVRAPSVRDSFDLASDVHATAVMAPPLNAALASVWWLDGTMERLVDAVRSEAMARQKIARRILRPDSFRAEPEGYHLWIPLPDGPGGADTATTAVFSGLPVVPARSFAALPTGFEQSLRFSLGGARSRERIERDLGRLDALLARNARA